MKKILLVLLVVCMLCVSMVGAGLSQMVQIGLEDDIVYCSLSTEKATAQIAKIADKYLNLDEDYFKPCQKTTESTIDLPWIDSLKTGLFEWWINVKYDGTEKSQKIEIPINEFDEFLKNPLYMREYYFDVDSDSDNDVQVKIGFYKATVLNMQTYTDTSGLATKIIIRTWFPDGTGLEDDNKDFQVWSEIHLNYGLFKKTSAKDSSPSIGNPLSTMKDKIENAKPGFSMGKIIERILQQRQNKIFTPFINLLNRIQSRLQEHNDHDVSGDIDIAPLASDDDWVSIGVGYHSLEGNRIPQVVEKHFTFARENIFNPSIFQHEMFPGGNDPYQLEFGFRAYNAGTADPENTAYDIGFGVEFEPAVYMRTQFIPIGGYVYYHFGQDSQSSQTRVTFLADIVKGSGDDLPLLTLVFDKIDSNLGRSGSWISFDLNLNGFEYKASSRFDVGINVGAPDIFDEKVQIKGLPSSVKFEWGVENTDFIIIPHTKFQIGLDVYASLEMNDVIDKIIVYYPRTSGYPEDAPNAPFLEVTGIPQSNRIDVGGSIDIVNGSILNVDVSSNIGLTMSGDIDSISVYYPKADWYDADVEFITLPHGLPGKMSANAQVKLGVDIDNLMNPSNYIYGKVSHDFSDKIDAINILLPDFEDPVVSFTEIPAYGELRGELYWARLQGYAYSYRNSNGKPPDPITINFEYDLDGDGLNDFKLYNKLKIRDGHIYTSFKIGTQGHFYFDTSNKMLEDVFRFYNYNSGDSLLISVDEISADNLRADWDIDTSGEQIQINNLGFGGIIDTLKGFDFSLDYNGKSASFDLDWVIGEQGNFAIELNQDNDMTLDFNGLFPNATDAFVLDGEVVLSKNFNFDMEWKLDLGEDAQNPGYFRINKYNDNENIKEFDLYFTIKDGSGKEVYGVDIYFLNPKIYLDLEWYFDIDDPIPPYVYYWLDVDFYADSKDVNLLWTDLQGRTDWIEVL